MYLSENQIQLIQNYFKTQPVLKAYVFGSYARGEADETSDVDLLVELDFSQRIGLKYVRMLSDLQDQLHKKVDLVAADGLSPRIAPFIHRDKHLIYAR